MRTGRPTSPTMWVTHPLP